MRAFHAKSLVKIGEVTPPKSLPAHTRECVEVVQGSHSDLDKSRGVFFSPIDGDRKLPACATRDIAAVAARLLLEASWSGVGHAAVLGPEDLSFNDMAAIIADVLGKPVRFQQVSFEAFKAGFIERGASKPFAQGMTDMMRAKNEGLDNAEPRTPVRGNSPK